VEAWRSGRQAIKDSFVSDWKELEARAGIEPAHKGFADLLHDA